MPGGPAPVAADGGWSQQAIAFAATSTPAVVGDIALVGLGVDGTQVRSAALDARTGRVLWQVHDNANRAALADVSTRPIGVVTSSGPAAIEIETDTKYGFRLVARAARTGAVLWAKPLPAGDLGPEFGPPIGCGTGICIGVRTGRSSSFESLDPSSGTQRWRQPGPPEGIAAPIYSGHGVVVAEARGANITAYATADGRPMWTITASALTRLGDERERTGGGPSWYLLGNTLIGSGDPYDRSSALTGIDLTTGAVRWTRTGWSFAGQGQPTVNDDGVTLASRTVLAFKPDKQLAAFGADGKPDWSVTSDRFGRFRGGATIGWAPDLGQVWLSDGGLDSEGRVTSTGALIRTGNRNPLVWVPSDDPLRRARGDGFVDVQFVNGARPGVVHADPAWAGPACAGLRLRADSSGGLFARRAA